MNTSSRRQKLEAMLADEPNDTFLRYSLAMELEKEGEHQTSLEMLRTLMGDDPPYVPAFFMAAKHLVQSGQVSQARSYLRDGIEHARQQGDSHAASEMGEMLTNLGALGE